MMQSQKFWLEGLRALPFSLKLDGGWPLVTQKTTILKLWRLSIKALFLTSYKRMKLLSPKK